MSLVLGAKGQPILSGRSAAEADPAYVAAAMAIMCGRFHTGKRAKWTDAVLACGKEAERISKHASAQGSAWIAKLQELDAALAQLDPAEQTLRALEQSAEERRLDAEGNKASSTHLAWT